MYIIYLLISEDYRSTYIGFSNNIKERVIKHQSGQVRTTRNFGKFRCFKLEGVDDIIRARQREKYWKSGAGRKKLKIIFDAIINMVSSSNG